LTGALAAGSVFFLYCPFSGMRLAQLLANLERVAGARDIRVACLDLPLPLCSWLEPVPARWPDLVLYRSTLTRKQRPENFVELNGIEPSASSMPLRRSPS